MLIKIASVQDSAAGRQYVNDILGRVFFPKVKDMELNAGHYAYAVETTQTQTYADDGTTLVNLAEPRKIWQITATFKTKAEAIEAAAEVGTLSMEIAAEVQKTAVELKLTDEQVKQLSAAW